MPKRVKGYTDTGIKGQSYHIHMAEKEHNGLWDRLYFRDYLINNKEIAKEYEKIKRELAEKYKYAEKHIQMGKPEFVKRITEIYRNSLLDTSGSGARFYNNGYTEWWLL